MSGNKLYGFIPEDRLSTRGILRTLFMPEIKLSFGSMGLTHKAFVSTLAIMFVNSGLLPYNHPAQNMNTIGKYGLRDLMGEAWYNLRQTGKGDLQQWGLFSALALLFSLTILSVLLIAGRLLTSTAKASDGSIFSPPEGADNDYGLQIIDHLIGRASRGEGSGIEKAIGEILAFYSYGILVIAAFIVGWSLLSIVVDTAASGRFFGGRHNPVWWPIRLVFALGILVPIGGGFNAGQLLVIEIAKWGSNFASNAWGIYVQAVIADEGGQPADYYLAKQFPERDVVGSIRALVQMHVCMHVQNQNMEAAGETNPDKKVRPLAPIAHQINFREASADTKMYRFGSKDEPEKCGSATFYRSKQDQFYEDSQDIVLFGDLTSALWGIDDFQTPIHEKMEEIYTDVFFDIANRIAEDYVTTNNPAKQGEGYDVPLPTDYRDEIKDAYIAYYNGMVQVTEAQREGIQAGFEVLVGRMKDKGWVVAPLWYYVLSSVNEEFANVISTTPTISGSINPLGIAKESIDRTDFFDTIYYLWNRNDLEQSARDIIAENERYMASFEAWWERDIVGDSQNVDAPAAAASAIDVAFDNALRVTKKQASNSSSSSMTEEILAFLGVDAMLLEYNEQIRGKGFSDPNSVHPIVLMAEAGRAMLRFASYLMIAPLATSVVLPGVGAALAQMFTLILSPLIIAGVVLSIILPMLPYIRFVFAISSWMIALLEAIVMIPIIALGHLRTDGEGLLGPSLQGAYVMLLQLLLRPILVLIGLILSMALVEITITYVNLTFFVMLDRLAIGGNADLLYKIIKFIGTNVMYGVVVYMLINSSFKIVDLFPESVIKFLGSGASGGIQDREDGSFNSAILASAVFASGMRPPVLSKRGKGNNPDNNDGDNAGATGRGNQGTTKNNNPTP